MSMWCSSICQNAIAGFSCFLGFTSTPQVNQRLGGYTLHYRVLVSTKEKEIVTIHASLKSPFVKSVFYELDVSNNKEEREVGHLVRQARLYSTS